MAAWRGGSGSCPNPSPRGEATAFNEPGNPNGELKAPPLPLDAGGVSAKCPCCAQLGMSWWGRLPARRKVIHCPTPPRPAPAPIRPQPAGSRGGSGPQFAPSFRRTLGVESPVWPSSNTTRSTVPVPGLPGAGPALTEPSSAVCLSRGSAALLPAARASVALRFSISSYFL